MRFIYALIDEYSALCQVYETEKCKQVRKMLEQLPSSRDHDEVLNQNHNEAGNNIAENKGWVSWHFQGKETVSTFLKILTGSALFLPYSAYHKAQFLVLQLKHNWQLIFWKHEVFN